MKILFFSLVCCLLSEMSTGHPGIGIVKDSKGNIFYTDLEQVWKINPAGHKTVAVSGVHTHELYIDSADHLYGEHLWYNGEKADTWGHYVWKLNTNGVVEKVKEPAAGFLENYSFIRDASGNMYWAERFTISRIKKRTPDGITTTIGEGKFRNIRWMSATKTGVVYFMDLDRLYKLHQGTFTMLAKDLNESNSLFSIVGDTHNAYGIWTDSKENIYVALYGGQQVKKITPGGKVSTVLYSQGAWSPTNGLFDEMGNCWILEYTMTGKARVRKIDKSGLEKKIPYKATLSHDILPPIGGIVVGLFLYALSKNIIRLTSSPPSK